MEETQPTFRGSFKRKDLDKNAANLKKDRFGLTTNNNNGFSNVLDEKDMQFGAGDTDSENGFTATATEEHMMNSIYKNLLGVMGQDKLNQHIQAHKEQDEAAARKRKDEGRTDSSYRNGATSSMQKEAYVKYDDEEIDFSDTDCSQEYHNLKIQWDVCESCSEPLPSRAKFCPECGKGVTKPLPKHCASCRYEFSGNEKFCSECGTPRI